MSYANIFTESNVDLLNDPAVKQLLDYIAELEAEYAHLDEVASKTIGLLTAERDQLRQQLDEIRPLKAVRKGRTKC